MIPYRPGRGALVGRTALLIMSEERSGRDRARWLAIASECFQTADEPHEPRPPAGSPLSVVVAAALTLAAESIADTPPPRAMAKRWAESRTCGVCRRVTPHHLSESGDDGCAHCDVCSDGRGPR